MSVKGIGQQSVVALNRGRATATLQLTGKRLIPDRAYNHGNWNDDGRGLVVTGLPKVAADANGNATVTVARQSLVALSTRPLN